MLTSDEAIAVGCRKFRELYPSGMIPASIEEYAVLGVTPGDDSIIVHVTCWFAGASDPFYLFRSSVNRQSGQVIVTEAADWRELLGRQFDDSQCL